MSAGQIWSLYFGYPAGAVWSNLIASVICVGVAWWRIRARQIQHQIEQVALQTRQHRERQAQADAHHAAQMELLRKQHSQLSDQIAAAAAAPAPAPAAPVKKAGERM